MSQQQHNLAKSIAKIMLYKSLPRLFFFLKYVILVGIDLIINSYVGNKLIIIFEIFNGHNAKSFHIEVWFVDR